MSDQSDTDMKRLDEALAVLSEHFDTVQIFVTRYDGGPEKGTTRASKSCGNFFARYGQIRQWLIAEDEETKELVRGKE